MDSPTSKPELMSQIAASWSALTEAVAGVDPTRMATPGPDGWSVKDHLAHIAAWERSVIAFLTGQSRAAAVGMDEAGYAAADVDAINARIVADTASTSYAEILARAQATHNELIGVLDRVSWDDLNQPYSHFQPGSDRDDPALNTVLGNTTEHYPEHREYLTRTATAAS
jgi:hypothetical protein